MFFENSPFLSRLGLRALLVGPTSDGIAHRRHLDYSGTDRLEFNSQELI